MPADYREYPFVKNRHPRGWVETTVGEVLLKIQSGFSSGKHNQTGEGIPHLRPMSVSPLGEITLEGVRYISPDAGSSRLADNDVLFTNTSSTVWVGKTAVVRKPGDWAFSNHMTRLRVGTGMNPEFVARQLHYLCMCGYFAVHCKKHVNQSSVAGKQLAEDVPFRCPPAKEQARITSKLTRLLKRERGISDALKTLPTLIQEYRTAVLDAACTGGLVPSEAELARKERREFEPASVLLERILEERRAKWESDQLAKMRAVGKKPKNDKWKGKYQEPVDVAQTLDSSPPAGWIVTSLDSLLAEDLRNGHSARATTTERGVRTFTLSAVTERDFSERNTKLTHAKPEDVEDLWAEPGDIYVERGNTPELVGTACLYRGPKNFAIIPDLFIRIRITSKVLPAYIEGCLLANSSRNYFQTQAQGTAGNMPKIDQLVVQRTRIALPPLAEQKRIVAEVDRRLSMLKRIEAEVFSAIEQTLQLRVSLFHRALSGKLVNQERTGDTASNLLLRIRSEREAKSEEAKRRKSQRKEPMKKLSSNLVREAILQFPKDGFTFADLSAAVRADYEPLKDIVFELLAEAKPSFQQVFDTKARSIRFQRIKA